MHFKQSLSIVYKYTMSKIQLVLIQGLDTTESQENCDLCICSVTIAACCRLYRLRVRIYQHCGAQRGLWWYSHFKPAKCEQLVVLSLKHKFTHVAVITRLILARVWRMQLPSTKYVLLPVHFAKVFLKVITRGRTCHDLYWFSL